MLRHVVESHFGWSHSVSVAMMQTLSPKHGLFAFLKPFTLGSHAVNSGAYHMLVRDHSILVHASGLTTEGLHNGFGTYFQHLNFSRTIPDLLESKKLDSHVTKNMTLFDQGLRLYYVHHDFVQKFIEHLYPSDDAMRQDHELARFWHHINSYGRHHDPCVCQMDSDLFADNNVWPDFESTRTCKQLLDFADYQVGKNVITRRTSWCTQKEDFERILSLRQMLEHECKEAMDCDSIFYNVLHMRADMGMTRLRKREQLIDFLSTFIWEVTAGHSIAGDNIPYLTDPEATSVRMRGTDKDGKLPLRTDVGTYVFGTAIGALTTVRSSPLLADWTPIYRCHTEGQEHLTQDEKAALFGFMNNLHVSYKKKLLKLSSDFLLESTTRPVNQRFNALNPATHESSVAV